MAASSKRTRPVAVTRRYVVQGLTLALFLATMWLAWPGGVMLRLDPLAAVTTMVAERTWLWALWPGLLALGTTLLFGRYFCSWVCPMGATVDCADRLCRGVSLRGRYPRLRHLSRAILVAMLAGALLGVSWIFWATPLALASRLYALIATPLLSLGGEWALEWLRPLGGALGMPSLQFAAIPVPRYATLWFQVFFFASILGAGLLAPRFWCRHLCPAGALLGVVGRKSLIRRRVSQDCIDCGRCQRRCPMDAIPEDPRLTRRLDCIVCETCAHVCPVQAVSFGKGGEQMAAAPAPGGRRWFLAGSVVGIGATMLARLELATPLQPAHVAQGVGELPHTKTIRPPGALPESAFLARCIRCGLCMTACPTNTLQPLWTEAGAAGVFSPVLTPRRGPCDPDCRVCTTVCPTQALRPLPLPEKQAVKIGTARVLRQRCLAWEEDKACLVCDEVCPYDAIELVRQRDLRVAVPIVHEHRCAGCGFCEYHCPVRAERAIIVDPGAAVRLASGSYIEENQARGLDITLAIHRPPPAHGHGAAPASPYGLQEEQGGNANALPPGFSDPNE